METWISGRVEPELQGPATETTGQVDLVQEGSGTPAWDWKGLPEPNRVQKEAQLSPRRKSMEDPGEFLVAGQGHHV